MSVRHVFAETLYEGETEAAQYDRLITIEAGRITSVAPAEARLPDDTLRRAVVAPGFIDMQINGAADVQFNDAPTAEAVARIAAGARQGGTAHLLPTFITAPAETYLDALAAVAQALSEKVPGVLGAHLEGPFLSREKPGIHPAAHIRPMTAHDCDAIGQAARGTTLVTLAPEAQEPGLIRRLSARGVRVSAGHSVATAADIDAAAEEGLTGVTHLFNAMPALAGRAPGIVGRALTHDALFAGIIADGHHVDPLNLSLAARLLPDRLCLVTDAMQTLAGDRTGFNLLGTPVTLDDGRLVGPDGTLAGAHLAMDTAVRTMVTLAAVPPGRAVAMASRNPAHALGLGEQLGRVLPGMRASLTFLGPDLAAEGVMIDGALANE